MTLTKYLLIYSFNQSWRNAWELDELKRKIAAQTNPAPKPIEQIRLSSQDRAWIASEMADIRTAPRTEIRLRPLECKIAAQTKPAPRCNWWRFLAHW
jgi:hypothetical protein